jgi:hypothetical protein
VKLTPELLRVVKDIIQKHNAAFVVDVFGPAAIPPEMVKELQDAGLLEGHEDLFETAYNYGQLVAKLQDPNMPTWDLAKVKAELTKNPIPLSAVEVQAVQTAKLNAAQYVVGLGNTIDLQTGQVLVEADRAQRRELQGKIRTETAEKIASRKTVGTLKSRLGHSMQDWTRDLDRIAITENHNVMQEGVGDGFRKQYGPEARVSLIPMPDACKHCKRLHLGPDGAPIIFKLSQLAPPGANVGKKAADWVACIGAIHPNCQCQIVRVPAGWGYDEDGTMIPAGEFGVEYEGDSEDVEKAMRLEALHMDALVKAYRLDGELQFQGLDVAIENGAGGLRFWKDHKNKTDGATVMLWPYGYIRRTLGVDGDHVDCFVGPNPLAPSAYIVHQRKRTLEGKFEGYDEDKIMLGFSSAAEAKAAYIGNYDDKGFFGSMTTMSMNKLKTELATTRDKPRKLVKAEPEFIIPNPNYVAPVAPPPAPLEPEARFTVRRKLRRRAVTLFKALPHVEGVSGAAFAVGGGQFILKEGSGGGVNIQADLPDKPHNPHDVAGVVAYLQDAQHRADVIVRRDPEIYVFGGGVDNQIYPIADAHGNTKNIITPDETENRAEEHKREVERLSFQMRDVPTNRGATRQPEGQWHPVQLEGRPRYPEQTDDARIIEGDGERKPIDLVNKAGEGSRGGKVVGHTAAGKPIYADKHAHEMSREEFLGKPKRTKAGHASDLVPKHSKLTEHVKPEEFKVEGHSSKFEVHRGHNDDATRANYVVTHEGKPIAKYDGTNLVVAKKHRRQDIGTTLVANFREDNPHIPVAETRTKNAQKTQEKAYELIQQRARARKKASNG